MEGMWVLNCPASSPRQMRSDYKGYVNINLYCCSDESNFNKTVQQSKNWFTKLDI